MFMDSTYASEAGFLVALGAAGVDFVRGFVPIDSTDVAEQLRTPLGQAWISKDSTALSWLLRSSYRQDLARYSLILPWTFVPRINPGAKPPANGIAYEPDAQTLEKIRGGAAAGLPFSFDDYAAYRHSLEIWLTGVYDSNRIGDSVSIFWKAAGELVVPADSTLRQGVEARAFTEFVPPKIAELDQAIDALSLQVIRDSSTSAYRIEGRHVDVISAGSEKDEALRPLAEAQAKRARFLAISQPHIPEFVSAARSADEKAKQLRPDRLLGLKLGEPLTLPDGVDVPLCAGGNPPPGVSYCKAPMNRMDRNVVEEARRIVSAKAAVLNSDEGTAQTDLMRPHTYRAQLVLSSAFDYLGITDLGVYVVDDRIVGFLFQGGNPEELRNQWGYESGIVDLVYKRGTPEKTDAVYGVIGEWVDSNGRWVRDVYGVVGSHTQLGTLDEKVRVQSWGGGPQPWASLVTGAGPAVGALIDPQTARPWLRSQ